MNTSNAVTTIMKVDYTITPHPSGVIAMSLQDAPALIESLLPVQKISIDSYKEQMAVQGKTLTALGSYWKGRKPLILNRACVLGSLLPATDEPIKDLEIFELLMGMDNISMSKRLGLAKPEDIVRNVCINDISAYFVVEAPLTHKFPTQAPFEVKNYPILNKKGELVAPKLRWRNDISDNEKHELSSRTFEHETYRELANEAKRAEDITNDVSTHIWQRVNSHLGTKAFSFSELVEQLGVMRFGHRPTVADTFSGSGQIPFAAAQLGSDVYASDLSPVACMLTWGAFNIIGATNKRLEAIESEQRDLVEKVSTEIEALRVEVDGNGWRGKVYLYCLEVICPSSGWRVPVLPTLIISKGKSVIAELIPDMVGKRYDIVLKTVSTKALNSAENGTYVKGNLIHSVNGVQHINSISSIRGDFTEVVNGVKVKKNKLRHWDRLDISYRDSDIYGERLYAIQWIKPDGSSRPQSEFRSITTDDLKREDLIFNYVHKNLPEWQARGWIPDMKIENGVETERLHRERGWTHWHHLFCPRQLLFLGMVSQHCQSESSYLYLARLLDWSSRLCRYGTGAQRQSIAQTFYNQALNPTFNYGVRSFDFAKGYLMENHKNSVLSGSTMVMNVSALDFDKSVDIFITDPPYGDAVKYEEIYEFFIAWLRKNKSKDFSDWTWDSRRELAVKGEDHSFKLAMISAYKRMTECMPDNGLQILMFTHQDGNIWADMANIVWASGLRVTAAWYMVTETDSALREGSYVKGTILLVLRKRLGAKRTNQTELAYELEDEVAEQINRLTGLNDVVTSDSKRAKDGNLFEDADLQMAGYAAALKVLTKYSIIDGKDMAQEALRPRVAGQTSLVDGLIEFAVNTANKALVPHGLSDSVWNDLNPAERFYLKMLDMESQGLHSLDNYQNFGKAFSVKNWQVLMASDKANKAALKSAKEFGRTEMNASSELFETPTRAALYALMDIQAEKDLDVVLEGLRQNLKVDAFFSAKEALISIARFIAKKLAIMRPEEASAARILADGIDNQRA